MKIKLKDLFIYWGIYTLGMTLFVFFIIKWSLTKAIIFSVIVGFFAYFLSAWISSLIKKKGKNKRKCICMNVHNY